METDVEEYRLHILSKYFSILKCVNWTIKS